MNIDANRASRARLVPLGGLAALIALAGIGVLIAQPSTASSPALLQIEEPSVEVRPDGRRDFSAVRSGHSVTEGSVLRTDRTGVAAVEYEDGSLTRIGPATTYELVTLRTEEGRREIIGKLDTGQTFHRVSKVTGSASRFEVETSDAVAAVRGTEFAVQCIVLDICEFAVTEGTVTVRAEDGREVDVTAGHRVTVDGRGRLGGLKLLSASDPWIARNTAGAGSSSTPTDSPAEEDDESTPSSPTGAEEGRFRSWGGYPAATSNSEVAAPEPGGEDGTNGKDEGARNEDAGTTTTTASGSTETTSARETTTTTSESTTTTSGPAPTTTTPPGQSTTTSTSSGGQDTTTTTRPDDTTTTNPGGEPGTTTSTTSGGSTTTTSAGGTTTTTSADGSTTTTSGGTPTTPTSDPGTTTTAPCPEGEEHVEGRGCMPECPHDRPRDPNGNCQRECRPGDQSEECRSAARSSSTPSKSKDAGPFLWVFSFLFGGTVLARRSSDRWEN